jgi:hypothetical protein
MNLNLQPDRKPERDLPIFSITALAFASSRSFEVGPSRGPSSLSLPTIPFGLPLVLDGPELARAATRSLCRTPEATSSKSSAL